MKKIISLAIFLVLAFILTSCVRPASGPAVKLPTQPGQSNPVSTQSALMKEIIAGTQTAMALASGVTPEADATNVPGATVPAGTQSTGLKTATPAYPSPTPKTGSVSNLPTQTPGPPPVVEMTYVGGSYSGAANEGVGTFIFTQVVRDQSVTIQTVNFPPNWQYTVRMGLYGTKGVNGIIVAFSNSGKGGTLTATYTIPDALRGQDRIHMRFDGDSPHFSFNWFYNTSTQ